jgi:DNA-binding NtrC family response regulator
MSSSDHDPTATESAVGIPIAPGRRSLVVLDGDERGRTIDLRYAEPRPLTIGRHPDCQIVLRDGRASGRHASLEVTDGGLAIRDLDSRNGTFVNGARVREAFLADGDTLRIGDTVLRVTVEARESALDPRDRFGPLLGGSPAMRRLYPLCDRLAASDVPVVVLGETGTGKEVLARALHEASRRAFGPLVVFDCTTTPANLLEAALFGHERGAFTGAVGTAKGVFEQAHGGTLLIDEIGDLELGLQAKLLRALERQEVRRVGGDRWISVDVRILAATRRDLRQAVASGTFRDDLFYRLAVASIELPPLRVRTGDVALLATQFWSEFEGAGGRLMPEVLEALEREPWPGNVRQLRNAVARYAALGDLAQFDALSQPQQRELIDFVDTVVGQSLPIKVARDRVLEEFERRYVKHVLEAAGGRLTKAAEIAGLAERQFRIIRARHRDK